MMARRIIAGLMLAGLLLAGQALAVARGQAPAAAQVVLCTGFGTQVVHLDAEGNRVRAPHLCPDGLAAMVAALVPLPEPALQTGAARVVDPVEVPVSAALKMRQAFEARGPPPA